MRKIEDDNMGKRGIEKEKRRDGERRKREKNHT